MKVFRLSFLFNFYILLLLFLTYPFRIFSQYKQQFHKSATDNVIPVSEPGFYGKAGASYMLVKDISSAGSVLFLGKDVTLDLNGFTITFADAGYEHLPNFDFEEGLHGWDLSKAPGAKIEDSKVHVFVGDKILRLSKGEEIVSKYINLPVSDRSYIAMCGVTRMDMKVSVYVEDEHGESIVCNTLYRDGLKQSCPVENKSPRLGGGFVYAHLTGLKAGKYRIRVRAETDCLLDYIDIRPSMDVGIGIVGKTDAMGHNDHLFEREHSAFFDYTEDAALSKPLEGIPVVTGKGTVTIKNGIIKNGTPGAISWGIQSTAEDVMVVLDNVKIINSGINATAADLLQANITNCSFQIDNPFIINRHGSEFYAVDLRGEGASEVAFNEFYGGQGCLVFKGKHSKIHHNLFRNHQTVTNHYSIMAMGDSSLIFNNIIKPIIGSGIEIFRHSGIEIFNNEIHVEAAPPTCEYGHEEYSTTALRIADYNAKPGAVDGCSDNKFYNNKIFVTGKDYPEYLDYIPMAWAVFYSASGGENYIFGNRIEVNDLSGGLKNETSAFYIGGGSIGGRFYDNYITTNVPAAWVASPYGPSENANISRNRIMKSATAPAEFKPFRMGWDGRSDCIARDIQFRSNEIIASDFDVDVTMQDHEYSVYWTLVVKVHDKNDDPLEGIEIKILDKEGKIALIQHTSDEGKLEAELEEYSYHNFKRNYRGPYTIKTGKISRLINLNTNKEIIIKK